MSKNFIIKIQSSSFRSIQSICDFIRFFIKHWNTTNQLQMNLKSILHTPKQKSSHTILRSPHIYSYSKEHYQQENYVVTLYITTLSKRNTVELLKQFENNIHIIFSKKIPSNVITNLVIETTNF